MGQYFLCFNSFGIVNQRLKLLGLILLCQAIGVKLEASPNSITFQSRIVKPDGKALEASSVNFRFSITDTVGTCVIYQEDFSNLNMSGSKGLINLSIGSGSKVFPVAAMTMSEVFNNFNSPSLNCLAGGNITAGITDRRKLVVQFNDGDGWQTVPSMDINSTPFSLQSKHAMNLGGFPAADYVRTAIFPTCGGSEALHFNGASFTCVTLSPSTVLAGVGSSGAPSLSFSGDVDTGLYSIAPNTIGFTVGGTNILSIGSTSISAPNVGAANIGVVGGTAVSPTFSFSGDTDTGWFRVSDNVIAVATNGIERMRIDSSGNVGVGNTPVGTAKLEVTGQIISQQFTAAAAATAINFSQGNVQLITSAGGSAITLSSLRNGGTYVLVIEDTTSRTYTFPGCTNSYYSPANAPTTVGTFSTFSFVVVLSGANTNCYISWVTGYL